MMEDPLGEIDEEVTEYLRRQESLLSLTKLLDMKLDVFLASVEEKVKSQAVDFVPKPSSKDKDSKTG